MQTLHDINRGEILGVVDDQEHGVDLECQWAPTSMILIVDDRPGLGQSIDVAADGPGADDEQSGIVETPGCLVPCVEADLLHGSNGGLAMAQQLAVLSSELLVVY
ncbi:hypothetical protein ACFQ1M_09845 [Sungkyunkwania multivorans]|uniref:Uncharacterized protein n=1 Tax=Sungkyunkwania multivorans TaxID=1173618 RepID=A0ABW3CYV2_9FLAO